MIFCNNQPLNWLSRVLKIWSHNECMFLHLAVYLGCQTSDRLQINCKLKNTKYLMRFNWYSWANWCLSWCKNNTKLTIFVMAAHNGVFWAKKGILEDQNSKLRLNWVPIFFSPCLGIKYPLCQPKNYSFLICFLVVEGA